MKRPHWLLLFGILAIVLLSSTETVAQCSMCSAVAETSQKNGNEMAEGLNAGILYLMGIPYALLLGIGILLFRKLNRNNAESN